MIANSFFPSKNFFSLFSSLLGKGNLFVFQGEKSSLMK
jgi:hypothetical protein